MMLHPVFVASVLEGFEGRLDEMIGRVANPELNSQRDALRLGFGPSLDKNHF